jgi:hypothetical protein
MPDWTTPHLLSFVTNDSGDQVTIHADLAGISLLIEELLSLPEQLELNECPHTHLFSQAWEGQDELTTTKLGHQKMESVVVEHVKINGWNEEWAVRHGLKG